MRTFQREDDSNESVGNQTIVEKEAEVPGNTVNRIDEEHPSRSLIQHVNESVIVDCSTGKTDIFW